MYKFHVFVLVNTIVFYLILKAYKSSVSNNTDNSRLIYLLYLPALLYTTRYLLHNTDYITGITKRVYPDSVSSI